MPSGYHHLALEERCQIYALRKSGISQREIARELEISPSTVSRELKRNSGRRGYRFKQAQARAEARRRAASAVPRKLTEKLRKAILRDLKKDWSPDQIAGRRRFEGLATICPAWIYELLRNDREQGGKLYRKLRRKGKKRNCRGAGGAGRGVIPGRVDISERPAEVEAGSRAGDYEVDTISGAGHRGAAVSMVERKTKFTLLALVPRKTSAAVGGALIRLLGSTGLPVRTITADNGKEFAGHREVAAALGAEFYFAGPYKSWERGLNEHTNGLVRQYFPKSTDFRAVSEEEVLRVQNLLNDRPRRVLGYRTPREAFEEALAASAAPG